MECSWYWICLDLLRKSLRHQVAEKQLNPSSELEDNNKCICPICEEIIVEPVKTAGLEAIFCSGKYCNTWVHRCCAGLPRSLFEKLSKSNDSFHCPHCRLKMQSEELDKLHSTEGPAAGEYLKSMAIVAAAVPTQLDQRRQSTPVSTNVPQPSHLDTTRHISYAEVASVSSGRASHVSSNHKSKSRYGLGRSASLDRRYNVVVSGIPECSDGISPHQRWSSDVNQISALFAKSSLAIQPSSILDCHRLGRFSSSNTRPRQILVYFNSCTVVMDILSKRSVFSPYLVKPDLSPEERANEKILMRARWELIKSGTAKSDIKVRRNSLFVNGQLHGKVRDAIYIKQCSESEDVGNERGLLEVSSGSNNGGSVDSLDDTSDTIVANVSDAADDACDTRHSAVKVSTTSQSSSSRLAEPLSVNDKRQVPVPHGTGSLED